MRGEFQSVEADAVNDDRQDIEDHVQAVAEHQKNDSQNHKQENRLQFIQKRHARNTDGNTLIHGVIRVFSACIYRGLCRRAHTERERSGTDQENDPAIRGRE